MFYSIPASHVQQVYCCGTRSGRSILNNLSTSAEQHDILIVDDDRGHVELMRALMKDLGMEYRLHHVINGRLALDFLAANPPFENAPRPRFIVLDLNMPGLTGHEVLRIIKSDSRLRTIPVIILSQSSRESDITACYAEHANAYIGKPSDLDSNVELLQELDRFWMRIATIPN